MDRFRWLNMMALGKVLEVGCEDGKVFRNNKSIDWTGIDNWRCIFQSKAGYRPDGTKVIEDIPAWQDKRLKELKKLLKGRNFIEADADNLPFGNEVFDTVVLAELLEHVKDPLVTVKESLRVLKNKGRVLVTIPDEWSWAKELDPFGHSGHLRHYKEMEVRDLMKKIKLPIKLFIHSPPNWNHGFVFWYIVLQKVCKNGKRNS